MTTPPLPPNEPVLGLRERSRRQRYERVLAAAEELFAEKDYDAVTTREVAQRAEVGEATLFRYIERKSDLLLLVIGGKLDILIDQLEHDDSLIEENPPSPVSSQWFVDRINTIYRARTKYYELDPEHVSKYIVSGLQTDSKLAARSTSAGDRIITRTTRILLDAQAAGVLRDDVDAETVARNLNGAYIHELLRTPARRLPISETWDRLSVRFDAMIRPLMIDAK